MDFIETFKIVQVFIMNILFDQVGHFEQYNCIYLFSFVETPRKFIIAKLSIRKLGSSSVLIIALQ